MSAELKETLELLVERVNKRVDLVKLKQQYVGDENRTLLFRVNVPGSEVEHGFVIEGDKIRMAGRVERPTVTFTCDNEETFWKIALRKKDFNWAFATRKLTVTGDHLLRDFLILTQIFESIRGQIGV